MKITRWKCLTTAAGAILAASLLPTLANDDPAGDVNRAEVLYGHGMVSNRDLPGVAGELQLSFDLYLDLETGTGFATANDPMHPD